MADWIGYLALTVLLFAVLAISAVRVSAAIAGGSASGHGPGTLVAVGLSSATVVGLVLYLGRWLTLPLMRRPLPITPLAPGRIAVVTTFVPGAEPLEMLAESLSAMVSMHHTHDTWVLDEGNDPQVRALCRDVGARHFTRKNCDRLQQPAGRFQQRTKHGNYNAWLDVIGYATYDVVLNFDPDHVPHADFLLRTIGYLRDPEVAYVQAAQAYSNQRESFVARGAAEETYSYYASVQMSSFALGYPIVTGCHTVHRMAALREVGGFAPHEADDLLITVLYRASRWRGVYVPEVLARGLVPVDWSGYLNQQRRWARSVLDIKFRVFPKVARRLPLTERVVSLCHGLYYLHGLASGLFVLVLAGGLATGAGPDHVVAADGLRMVSLVGILVSTDLFRQRFLLDRRSEFGFHWRSGILRFAKWPYVFLALVDALRNRYGTYEITPKVRRAGTSRGRATARGMAIAHAAAATTVGAGAFIGHSNGNLEAPAFVLGGAYVALSLGIALAALGPLPKPNVA